MQMAKESQQNAPTFFMGFLQGGRDDVSNDKNHSHHATGSKKNSIVKLKLLCNPNELERAECITYPANKNCIPE